MRSKFHALLVVVVVALTALTRIVVAEQRSFHSADLKISVAWPESFERVSAQSPLTSQALLLLKSKNGAFPTLNLLLVPGPFNRTRGTEDILESYKLLGLTDTEVLGSTLVREGWPQIDLSYHSVDGRLMRSVVTVIPRLESYIVVTFICEDSLISSVRGELELIIHSIKSDAEGVEQTGEIGRANSWPALWIVVGILAIVAALSTKIAYSRLKNK